jgi:ABC-type lipoprotein export system ATPase subunit
MQTIDIVKESTLKISTRMRQVSCMFDVSCDEKMRLEWHLEIPLDERQWNVGLITGPSGCGKSTVAKELFKDTQIISELDWNERSVIDNMPKDSSLESISEVCQAVGFNTIPAWLRPYGVLSTGEQFRVTLARRMLEEQDLIVFDEFTSVVDRQVAQIASFAVAKYIRKKNRQFVAVTCHHDIVNWLQPDWILNPATDDFNWRSLQRRPQIDCTISRVPISAWQVFAKYHYLSSTLNRSSQCWALWMGNQIACFYAVLHKPLNNGSVYYVGSRMVCLPDFQGLGLAHVLAQTVGRVYSSLGYTFFRTTSLPNYARQIQRLEDWQLQRLPRIVPKGLNQASGFSHERALSTFKYVAI